MIGELIIKRLPDHFFSDVRSYSKLLLSNHFYSLLSDYQYILIYQLDCLIFSDRLKYWISMGYDYIGAPLFRSKTDPNLGFSHVGNGGLSLRKVESFIHVLESKHVPNWADTLRVPMPDLKDLGTLQRLFKRIRAIKTAQRGVSWYTEHYTLNEDLFWSDRARLFYPKFNIAPVDVALKFAFERFPSYCYEQNNRQLPFGCHAWAKWDREFWEPFLINSNNSSNP